MIDALKTTRTSAIAMTVALFAATPLLANEITLQSSDGTVDLTGELVSFDDNVYIVRTALGEIRIARDRVNCQGDGCPTSTSAAADLVIGGSDTVGLGLMPLLLEGYSGASDAELQVSATGTPDEIIANMTADQGFGAEMPSMLVNSTTSSDGFRKLQANEIEIGMASRRIRPAEAQALREDGAGNMISPSQEHIIAVDSLVLVTHPSNTVRSLTIGQVADIYSGQITNWSSLGGPDLAITVIDRPDGSGTRSVFESRIFGDSDVADFSGKVIADTNSEASQLVTEDESAIAYVGYAFQRNANALTLVNECGIPTIPDAFSAKTEEYALQRRLYLYTRQDTRSEVGQAFVDYATSTAADTVIQKAGFTGFGIQRRVQSMDSPRASALLTEEADAYEGGFMREMLGQMVDFDRLSTTFRFRTGSSNLDERGVIDLDRLIGYLQNLPEGSEVLLVGFTDNVGEFESNLALSRQRAAQVADQVRASGGDLISNVSLSSVGFGEIAPSGCNSSDNGRQINRRVEVWLKQPG